MSSFPCLRQLILGWTVVAVVIASAGVCRAQVDCVFKKVHLSRLQGIVTDQLGETIPDAAVILMRGEARVAESKTDEGGRFAFKGVSGNYDLTIDARNFKRAWSPIEIGPDITSIFHSNVLRVMVLVGAGEECELFTTNEKEFKKAIAANRQRFKETKATHATQN